MHLHQLSIFRPLTSIPESNEKLKNKVNFKVKKNSQTLKRLVNGTANELRTYLISFHNSFD